MQLLQWLFKATHDKGKDDGSGPTNQKERANDQEVGRKHIIVFKQNGGVYNGRSKNVKGSKLGTKKYLKLFLLCRKDTATACFYNTINLRRPSDINDTGHHWRSPMKMKKEDIARGLGINKMQDPQANNSSGNKVLPISETTSSANSSGTNDGQSVGESEKKDKSKVDKAKTMSRMKELLRWAAAAAAKSEKASKFMGRRKVLQFRNRGALKAVPDDDQLSNESPKISFRWDVESCSTISSAYSSLSLPSSLKNGSALATQRSLDSISNIHDSDHSPQRKGNWITTDLEFVVLEL